jgi:hypothetical protein
MDDDQAPRRDRTRDTARAEPANGWKDVRNPERKGK